MLNFCNFRFIKCTWFLPLKWNIVGFPDLGYKNLEITRWQPLRSVSAKFYIQYIFAGQYIIAGLYIDVICKYVNWVLS